MGDVLDTLVSMSLLNRLVVLSDGRSIFKIKVGDDFRGYLLDIGDIRKAFSILTNGASDAWQPSDAHDKQQQTCDFLKYIGFNVVKDRK